MREWFEKSPLKSQNDFFFCTVNGPPKPLSQNALGIILKRLAVKAGLGKWKKVKSSHGVEYSQYQGQRIYFTKFRRSAATWALKNLKSHALAGKRIWGNEASSMIKIYSGLVSEDANEAYREALGLAQPALTENILKPKTCFKCHTILSPTQSLCPNCKIETDTSKLIDTQLLKEAEMTALREEMKMLQTALAQITLKMRNTG